MSPNTTNSEDNCGAINSHVVFRAHMWCPGHRWGLMGVYNKQQQ
jgi:hypothetical protein